MKLEGKIRFYLLLALEAVLRILCFISKRNWGHLKYDNANGKDEHIKIFSGQHLKSKLQGTKRNVRGGKD